MEMNRGGLIGPAEFAFLANRRILTELFFFPKWQEIRTMTAWPSLVHHSDCTGLIERSTIQ
jgi:hypothetical protein